MLSLGPATTFLRLSKLVQTSHLIGARGILVKPHLLNWESSERLTHT